MAILYPHHIVGVEDLPVKIKTFSGIPMRLRPLWTPAQTGAASAGEHDTLLPMHGLDLKEYLANLERSLIGQALDDGGGVVARAASRYTCGGPHWWRRCVSIRCSEVRRRSIREF